MQRLRGMLRRFRFPWRSTVDIRRDVDEELRFHLTLRAEELERHGLSPADAHREALRRFGDLEGTRRELTAAGRRAERVLRLRDWLDGQARDARHALRSLRRDPKFTIAATLVLAFGISASVVVFTLLDTLVLRPLPVTEPDRLFQIGTQPPPDAQWTMQTVQLAVVNRWEADAQSLEEVAAFVQRDFNWRSPDGPERLAGAAVVGELFALLGATLTVGQSFTGTGPDSATVVLSDTFWRRRFAARPDIIGETLELDGVLHTVVGVLPPETRLPFLGGDRLLWIPLPPSDARGDVPVRVVARLHAGIERDAAAAELASIQRSVEEERGVARPSAGVVLQSLQEDRSEIVGPTLVALFGGSLVLLLIACANVGTLSLSRLVERRHELAVRSSLGASRWRLLRQVLTEHVVLWSIGGAAGLALGAIGLRWVSRTNPLSLGEMAALDTIAIDTRVALFACAATLGAALAFGLLPALQSSDSNPVGVLREDGTTASSSRRSRSWRQLLVVAQVALSTVLASGACLLALSLSNMTSQPLGFKPSQLVTFRVQLPQREYTDQQTRRQFQRALVAALRELPGIEAAATTSAPPLGVIPVGPIGLETDDSRNERPWAGIQAIGRDYLRTAGIAVIGGRTFDDGDRAAGDPVALVNETFARSYFPGQDPVGRRVAVPAGDGPQRWLRIVGVIADVKHAGLDWDYLPELFLPYEQIEDGPLGSLLGGDIFAVLQAPDALVPTASELRRVVSELDRDLPVTEIQSGEQIVIASADRARFRATIMGAVAALAVLLAGMGLWAVLQQSVAQRRKEFGIRMALGASPGELLRSVCRYGLALAALGVAAGVLAALALARYVQSLLYGVSALEPAVLAGVAIFMLAVGAAAAALPAWRTATLSPTVAIRNEWSRRGPIRR